MFWLWLLSILGTKIAQMERCKHCCKWQNRATFPLTRNYCNLTASTCSIALKFEGGFVQLLPVFVMNFGGRNSSNGDDTNLVVSGKNSANSQQPAIVVIRQLKLVSLLCKPGCFQFMCWLCFRSISGAKIAQIATLQKLLWMAKLGPYFYWPETIVIQLHKLVRLRWNSKGF